jgi:hypothetical protein
MSRRLLSELRDRDVVLRIDGHDLRINAPEGVVDADLRAKLVEHKHELLTLLRAELANHETGSGLEARWSIHHNWVSLRSLATEEEVDIRVQDCPDWMLREADRRQKEDIEHERKGGRRGA